MSKNDYVKALEKSAVIAFVPDGRSMWPFLKAKKQTVIIARKEGKLSPFSVALYKRDNGDYALHRVLRLADGGYQMKGDSQRSSEFVLEGNVVGVLKGYYKKNRYFDAASQKFISKGERWHKSKIRRRTLIILYDFKNKVKDKLKQIFKGRGK